MSKIVAVINTSFVASDHYLCMAPSEAVNLSIPEVMQYLESQFGSTLYLALDLEHQIPSPAAHEPNTDWLKKINTVGINVRTIGTFWHILPYVLTLPRAQQAIHLLPIFEPGVVASMYGPASWNLNPNFFNNELAGFIPPLNTPEKQLRAVVNILHLMGKVVGLDVIPHTDRFSEAALANPWCFEWLQRQDLEIKRHDETVFEAVQGEIWAFLQQNGSAAPNTRPLDSMKAFFEEYSEKERLSILFGEIPDYEGRLARRKMLVQRLYELGYETVPATMGPPYRGIEIDPSPGAEVIDEEGRSWRDYRITRPETFSRVFGPLARFKLYQAKNNNQDWELDFDTPLVASWEYVSARYDEIQAYIGFDFMRGDMSHVQMRPEGVPAKVPPYYDILRAVKEKALTTKPWFGYFAESFLAPPGEMAYGDECDHLEACLADSTLGDLQSEPVGTDKFVRDFAQYDTWLRTRQFAPNFTILTGDKDDPRFDAFYLKGNEIRYFIALFLTDMPSYMGLGFECRDPHPQPAPNEHYTKLYVFHLPDGPKSTSGPYQWGKNMALYQNICRQKQMAERLWDAIGGQATRWVHAPDVHGERKNIAWMNEAGSYLFVANLDTAQAQPIPAMPFDHPPIPIFSTQYELVETEWGADCLKGNWLLGPGEGRIFRLSLK